MSMLILKCAKILFLARDKGLNGLLRVTILGGKLMF
jgi:hypothetical protein